MIIEEKIFTLPKAALKPSLTQIGIFVGTNSDLYLIAGPPGKDGDALSQESKTSCGYWHRKFTSRNERKPKCRESCRKLQFVSKCMRAFLIQVRLSIAIALLARTGYGS